jgi:hypothetical protein
LKLKCDEPLSKCAFKFKLRRYHKELLPPGALSLKVKDMTADSHSLVVFFGDRTYHWLPNAKLSDFTVGRCSLTV